jgi:hypothetical protein
MYNNNYRQFPTRALMLRNQTRRNSRSRNGEFSFMEGKDIDEEQFMASRMNSLQPNS